MSGRAIATLVLAWVLSAAVVALAAWDLPRGWPAAQQAASWALDQGQHHPAYAALLGAAAGGLGGFIIGRHWPAAKK